MKKHKNFISKFSKGLKRFIFPVKFFIYSVFKKTERKITNRNLKLNKDFEVRISRHKDFKMVYYGGAIERETFRNGLFKTWENDVGWIWIELCKMSQVVFDIGANTGIYSLVAKSMNPSAIIYSFEPSIHSFKKLELNNKINDFDIICEQLAISNQSKEQIFYDIPDTNQTTASLSPDKMKYSLGYSGDILEYKVNTITISDYIKKHSIQNIDLIKIDVELHEAEVVEGLATYLIKFKPILILEILNQSVASRLGEHISLNDFNLFHLKKNSKAEQLKSFNLANKIHSKGEWNYLLFHKDLGNKIKNFTTLYN
jgi:FkbM family methyltransferase